ncbi:hypothetical protein [Brevibacillus dissolubilis]|uniref:hypothetical protein n=1 Tax=Brevibacillus dissolubilis TaxID=1844116 RepID=UPI0011168F08|nr:hypothetical protein [Brevibacillus dissolubilis]
MKKTLITTAKWAAVILASVSILLTQIEIKAAKYSTSDMKPEPFLIGVIDSQEDSAIGKVIKQERMKKEKSITKLDRSSTRLPAEIDAVWVAQKEIGQANVQALFQEAQKQQKPFYVYGENLDAGRIHATLGSGIELLPDWKDGNHAYQLDMMGYKFENGSVKPSFVLSANRNEQAYELDDLKQLSRRYNVDIKKKDDITGFFATSAYAGGMTDISVPDSYSPIYTWEALITNYVPLSATQTGVAKTYHVWKVYKDDTPADTSMKDYIYIRADEPVSAFSRLKSEEVVSRLDADQASKIITTAWKPDNSSWSGSVSMNIGFPPSATVSWNTDGDVEIFGSTGSLADDWHSFSVEDNEWTDTLLRQGDTWISTQSYSISQGAVKHKIGHRLTHTVNGKSGYVEPGEYSKLDAKSWVTNYVYWVISK